MPGLLPAFREVHEGGEGRGQELRAGAAWAGPGPWSRWRSPSLWSGSPAPSGQDGPSLGLSFTSMKEDAPLAPDQDLQGHLTWALSPKDSEVVDEMGIEKTKVFEELAPTRGWMQPLLLGLITNKRGVSKCWRPQAS